MEAPDQKTAVAMAASHPLIQRVLRRAGQEALDSTGLPPRRGENSAAVGKGTPRVPAARGYSMTLLSKTRERGGGADPNTSRS